MSKPRLATEKNLDIGIEVFVISASVYWYRNFYNGIGMYIGLTINLSKPNKNFKTNIEGF